MGMLFVIKDKPDIEEMISVSRVFASQAWGPKNDSETPHKHAGGGVGGWGDGSVARDHAG